MNTDNLSGWYGWDDNAIPPGQEGDDLLDILEFQPLAQAHGRVRWPCRPGEICEGLDTPESVLTDHSVCGWDNIPIRAVHADEVRLLLLEAIARKALGGH